MIQGNRLSLKPSLIMKKKKCPIIKIQAIITQTLRVELEKVARKVSKKTCNTDCTTRGERKKSFNNQHQRLIVQEHSKKM